MFRSFKHGLFGRLSTNTWIILLSVCHCCNLCSFVIFRFHFTTFVFEGRSIWEQKNALDLRQIRLRIESFWSSCCRCLRILSSTVLVVLNVFEDSIPYGEYVHLLSTYKSNTFHPLQNTDGADSSNGDHEALHSADAIVIIRGQKEDDFAYSKSAAMQVCFPSFSCPSNVLIRHGYSVMKCMMFLWSSVKILWLYSPVRRKSIISNK